jgi:hypothetical protein
VARNKGCIPSTLVPTVDGGEAPPNELLQLLVYSSLSSLDHRRSVVYAGCSLAEEHEERLSASKQVIGLCCDVLSVVIGLVL